MHDAGKTSVALRFDKFELDPAGELRSEGKSVKLQDQPLQILRLLVERPGQIVTREELRAKIWPSHTFVDFDHGINNAVKRLREALGDTAETSRFIETIPRRGYRFIATIDDRGPRTRSLAVLPLENPLVQQGSHGSAIAQMEDVVQLTRQLPLHLSMLGSCYASAGRREDALRVVQELNELSPRRYISSYWPAIIYATLNETNEAFRYLEAAYQERSAWMVYTKHWAWMDNLRGDPRFDDLVPRMNFP